MNIQFIKDERLVIITMEGDFDLSDLLNLVQQVRSDPAYQPGNNYIVDVSKAHHKLSYNEVQKFVSRIGPSLENTKVGHLAIVNTSREQFGVSSILATRFDKLLQSVSFFNSFEEAKEWISSR